MNLVTIMSPNLGSGGETRFSGDLRRDISSSPERSIRYSAPAIAGRKSPCAKIGANSRERPAA
jgi:hypothetical protein